MMTIAHLIPLALTAYCLFGVYVLVRDEIADRRDFARALAARAAREHAERMRGATEPARLFD
jgi:hypothetical protein